MSALAPAAEGTDVLEPEDVARARWYSFFSRWFLAPPDQKAVDLFLSPQPPAAVASFDAETDLELAWHRFAEAVAGNSLARMRAAYDDTFISVGEAPVSLNACVYLTGFSNERPLAEVRQWLAAQGIQGTHGGLVTEDHFGLLCEVMTWLIIGDGDAAGRVGESRDAGDAAQRHLFGRFIAPACDEFCRRLGEAPDAGVYRELGSLFGAFTAVERQAFDIER